MYRILLIDDHAVVRKGLKAILKDESPAIVVDEASGGFEGLDKLRGNRVDAVVLDIDLPDKNGLDVLKRIKREWPKLPVLILSIYSEAQYGLRVLRAGASGYLNKASAPENLVTAVNRILDGGRYVTPGLAEKLADEIGHAVGEEPEKALSDREYQIFRMIASGQTVSEIARGLSLSVKTISTHRSRILAKMNMRSNAELMHYAVKRSLVE